MNLLDVGWAAGLFEGEGTIYLRNRSLRLGVGTTDRDVAARFAEIIGGNLLGPYKQRGLGTKEVYHAYVMGFEKVQAVVAMFWSLLGERRQSRIAEVLDLYHSRMDTKPIRRRDSQGRYVAYTKEEINAPNN